MKCSLGISDFLEEISSLSHSVVFLYFFALIAEECFLISSCYSLELCIQMLKLLKYKLKTNIMNRVLLKLYNNLQNISSILSKNCLKKGSLCGKWEGSSRGRGHMISYGWFMLMYGRNHHNTVKYPPIKNKIKKKRKGAQNKRKV